MTPSQIPRHIAIIMDGNGRWAKKRLLPRYAGHRAGVETVRHVITRCAEMKVEVLSLFAFSSENWRRPLQEVSLLMDLFIQTLQNEVNKLHENGICLRFIGAREAFSPKLQTLIKNAEMLTQPNTGLKLIIAANYGGHWDIVQATRAVAHQIEKGVLRSVDITEEHLSHQLSLADLPPPDLFIRTGGEQRISNFFLWQLAYTELYFTDILWPDFDQTAFNQALTSFASRQRRFGRTGDQVEGNA